MRLLFLTFSLPLVLWGAEPSAFGAGNLDDPNPYGLTGSEKYIYQNKQSLQSIEKKTRTQQTKVESIQERVDGLQTIVEGLVSRAQENHAEFTRFKQSAELSQEEQQRQNAKIEAMLSEQAEGLDGLKKVLGNFSAMLDKISADYVSKQEYNALVNDVNAFKKLVGSELKNLAKGPVSSAETGKSNAQVANDALELYNKKNYTKAIELYEYLIEHKYKPARAHYMIGEMLYYRKEYENAIAYFKKSAQLYDKASYMPVLLLHTAVAMEQTGDSQNAEAFYNTIIAKYPQDKIASDARKRLEKLQGRQAN